MMNHHYVNPAHSDAQVAIAEKTYQHSDLHSLLFIISFSFISSQNLYYSYEITTNYRLQLTDLPVLFLVRVKPGMHPASEKPNPASHPSFSFCHFPV
jgi:hypothetical protein